ncbi:MAG: hypothetical protein IPN53_20870 [Comamonadaceae bacterium]|nr:hypothetical protein [Comamonadaceae bacterium]
MDKSLSVFGFLCMETTAAKIQSSVCLTLSALSLSAQFGLQTASRHRLLAMIAHTQLTAWQRQPYAGVLAMPLLRIHKICLQYSVSPKLGKGFVEVLDALELQSGFVIAPVSEPFPLSRRAMALPLSHLATIWQSI